MEISQQRIKEASFNLCVAIKKQGESMNLATQIFRIPPREGGVEVMEAATELLLQGVKGEDVLPTLEKMGLFNWKMMRPLYMPSAEDFYKKKVEEILDDQSTTPWMRLYVERCIRANMSWQEIYDGLRMY